MKPDMYPQHECRQRFELKRALSVALQSNPYVTNTLIQWQHQFFCRWWFHAYIYASALRLRITMPSPPQRPPPGLARVTRKVSAHPELFPCHAGIPSKDRWLKAHVEYVEELPLNTIVLVLPHVDTDAGWTPVLAPPAHFTWVHPDCLCPVPLPNVNAVNITVGHCKDRGSKPASHPEMLNHSRCSGTFFVGRTLYLDCRWNDHEHDSYENKHSGHCREVCVCNAMSARRVADILRFATLLVTTNCTDAVVFCKRGKHRSVSAGVILQLLCKCRVNFSEVWTLELARRCNICDEQIIDNIAPLTQQLRQHRYQDTIAIRGRLLSTLLNLPDNA